MTTSYRPIATAAPIPRASSIRAHSLPHPWQRSAIRISLRHQSTYALSCDTIRHFATDSLFSEPRTLFTHHAPGSTPICSKPLSLNPLHLIHVPKCPTMSHIPFSLSLSPCPSRPPRCLRVSVFQPLHRPAKSPPRRNLPPRGASNAKRGTGYTDLSLERMHIS